MRRCILLIVALLAASFLDASAQFAVVQGRVVDAESETPLVGVNVHLQSESGSRGTATNEDGGFTIANVPPGTYVLDASFVGYGAYSDTLEIEFGQRLFFRIQLGHELEEMDELVVESEDGRESQVTGPAHIQVRSADLQRVPMPDVSSDLMAYLVTRPGVVMTGDRGGQLFIRGGTPAQNLVLVDGMRIFQPFHIVGFYSVFPADIVAYADVFPGGYSARYGGRISSVIDVTTRNGSKQRIAGSASLAPFLASVRAEIPFIKNQVSILASARESVIERVAPGLLGVDLPYRFGDRFVKMHAYLTKTSTLSATVLHSFDEGDVAGLEDDERLSTWRNTAVGARYVFIPPDYPILSELAVYHTNYESRFVPSADQERTSDVEAFHGEIRFAYLFGDLQLHFGVFAATSRFDYDLGRPQLPQQQNVTEGGMYIAGEWRGANGLHVEPGARVQAYSSGIGGTVEPRVRASWTPGGRRGRQTFSAAWGIYYQQVLGVNNQRDVTDAFTAWAAAPTSEPLPRSQHAIVGWQRQLLPSLRLNAEAYHRAVENISFPFFDQGFGRRPLLERVDGSARGLDFSAEYQHSWIYAFAGYSLSYVQYQNPRRQTAGVVDGTDIDESTRQRRGSFSPPHERRHQLNVMAQAAIGAYRLSVRWQYGSGIPFTPINGYFLASPPNNTADRSFLTDPGTVQVSFADPYSARLPSYHRLDVSGERDFTFDGWRIVAHAGLINAYDRNNIFSYDLLQERRVDQLPIIPSAGLRVELDR